MVKWLVTAEGRPAGLLEEPDSNGATPFVKDPAIPHAPLDFVRQYLFYSRLMQNRGSFQLTACYYGNLACAKLLVRAGCDVTVTSDLGMTAKMLAIGQDQINVLRWIETYEYEALAATRMQEAVLRREADMGLAATLVCEGRHREAVKLLKKLLREWDDESSRPTRLLQQLVAAEQLAEEAEAVAEVRARAAEAELLELLEGEESKASKSGGGAAAAPPSGGEKSKAQKKRERQKQRQKQDQQHLKDEMLAVHLGRQQQLEIEAAGAGAGAGAAPAAPAAAPAGQPEPSASKAEKKRDRQRARKLVAEQANEEEQIVQRQRRELEAHVHQQRQQRQRQQQQRQRQQNQQQKEQATRVEVTALLAAAEPTAAAVPPAPVSPEPDVTSELEPDSDSMRDFLSGLEPEPEPELELEQCLVGCTGEVPVHLQPAASLPPSAAAPAGREEIQALLAAEKLAKYHEALVEEGYSFVDDLLEADDEDIAQLAKDVRMKKPEAKRFLKAVAAKSATSVGQPPPPAEYKCPISHELMKDPVCIASVRNQRDSMSVG